MKVENKSRNANVKIKMLVYFVFVGLFVVLLLMGGYYLLFVKNPSSGDLKVKMLNTLSRAGIDPHRVSFLQLNSGDMPTKPMEFITYLEDQGRNFSYSFEAVINSEPVSESHNNEYTLEAKSELGQDVKLKITDGLTNIIWDKKLWESRLGVVVESVEKSEDSESEFLCDDEYCSPHKSAEYLKEGDKVTVHYYKEIEPKDAIRDNIFLTDMILSEPVTSLTVKAVGL